MHTVLSSTCTQYYGLSSLWDGEVYLQNLALDEGGKGVCLWHVRIALSDLLIAFITHASVCKAILASVCIIFQFLWRSARGCTEHVSCMLRCAHGVVISYLPTTKLHNRS
jgi:hypothetical protein